MKIRRREHWMKYWQLPMCNRCQIGYTLRVHLLATVSVVGSVGTVGLVGCSQQKEVEYPPEVIPDIPPGNRTDEVTDPPS